MTRVLFLDIDGVLNSRAWLRQRPSHALGSDLEEVKCNLDPEAVARLDRVVRETGCLLVLSSSWRCHSPLPIISRALRETGLGTELIGATPELGGRGREIRAWLDTFGHPVDFVILDDDDQNLGELATYLVQTEFATGLCDSHVLEIIERFATGRSR